MRDKVLLGHILAIWTTIIWGSTFSSTKALLADFSASEILLIRFVLAYILLSIIAFRGVRFRTIRQESLFIVAGLSGACLYFLLENIALNYTSASNASLLVAINPIFTAILCLILFKKPLNRHFVFGSILAFVGIFLVVFQGQGIKISLFGDLLCILAGFVWSIYTLILERIFAICSGENSFAITRRIFFYGILFTLVFYALSFEPMGFGVFFGRFYSVENLLNLAFLGILASALCYVSWNKSLQFLGTLKAGAYIYAVPVIGVIVAVITLGESVNFYLILGGILTLIGLFYAQK